MSCETLHVIAKSVAYPYQNMHFGMDTEMDPAFHFDMDPVVSYRSESLLFERGNVPVPKKYFLYVHLNLTFFVCRLTRTQPEGILFKICPSC
jgi:hypothetical protein